MNSDFNMNDLQGTMTGMDMNLGEATNNPTGMDSDDLVPSLQVSLSVPEIRQSIPFLGKQNFYRKPDI